MIVLVTAGPTREPIDPVRFLSNRSSGKMGFAIAAAAATAGHSVILIAGPVCLPTPDGVQRIDVTTAAEMMQAVQAALPSADSAVFCAAVADYRPANPADRKLKKSGEALTLTLVPTADILGSVRHPWNWHGILAGFAAETDHVLANARHKLSAKGCDLIVANDVSLPDSGFESDHNTATFLFRDGSTQPLPRQRKEELAAAIVTALERLHRQLPPSA
jgi:phosphopantothenoylcysteine decarboxylase/phosphopantothenate--cysteine ligase